MMPRSFRTAFSARKPLLGAFIKSPNWQGIEIIGAQGYDFTVIDEEHAPFNRETVDVLILAARASGVAPLVRVRGIESILQALDCGAEGVMVPHISSKARAEAAVAACFYGIGRRGYSPSGRAGNYGAVNRAEHLAGQDNSNTLIAMIEDPEALAEIDAICAVPGITGLFIGRGDLTAAYAASGLDAPQVVAAVDAILAAAWRANLPVAMNVETPALAQSYATLGASAFIIGSDQGFLKKAAASTLASYADLRPRST
jgi:staphyloferrin B biosynthesis citrate synthase